MTVSTWEDSVKLTRGNTLQIRLSSQGLTDEQMCEVSDFLDKLLESAASKNVCANSIELSENAIGNKGIIAFADVLERHDVHVKCMKLYKNRIGDEGAFRLSDFIKNQVEPMEELHLSHNLLTGLALVSLCLAFHQHRYQAYPFRSRSMAFIPCWVRLEYNSIANPKFCLDLLKKETKIRICLAENRDLCGPWRCCHSQMQSKDVPSVHLFAIQNTCRRAVKPGVDSEDAIRDLIQKSSAGTSDAVKLNPPAILNASSTTCPKAVSTAGCPKVQSTSSFSTSIWRQPTANSIASEEMQHHAPETQAYPPLDPKTFAMKKKVKKSLNTTEHEVLKPVEMPVISQFDRGKNEEERRSEQFRVGKSVENKEDTDSTLCASLHRLKGKIHAAQLVTVNEALRCPFCSSVSASDPIITCSHIICPDCFQEPVDKSMAADWKLDGNTQHEKAVHAIVRRFLSNQHVRCVHHPELYNEVFGKNAEAVQNVVKCEYVGDMTSILKHQEVCDVQKHLDSLKHPIILQDEKMVRHSKKLGDTQSNVPVEEKGTEVSFEALHTEGNLSSPLSTIFEEPEHEQEPEEKCEEGLPLYRCMYDFDPQSKNQLCIRLGDMVLVYNVSDAGWAAGQKVDPANNQPFGPVGWFPESYTALA